MVVMARNLLFGGLSTFLCSKTSWNRAGSNKWVFRALILSF